MSESELLPVEQVDRDAAAPLMYDNVVTWRDEYLRQVREGIHDNTKTVQAFARHRLTATTPAEKLAEALGLARNRLARCAVEAIADGKSCSLEWSAWADEATRSLAVYKEQTK